MEIKEQVKIIFIVLKNANNYALFIIKKIYQEDHPNKPENDRPYQAEWSQMIKEKANFECEICGSKANLVAHHIQPVKPCPHLQADVDNGVCLCVNCHHTHGHKDECSTGNLANAVY